GRPGRGRSKPRWYPVARRGPPPGCVVVSVGPLLVRSSTSTPVTYQSKLPPVTLTPQWRQAPSGVCSSPPPHLGQCSAVTFSGGRDSTSTLRTKRQRSRLYHVVGCGA